MSSKPIIEALKSVLADNYMLYLKTQNYHWNVEGPRFRTLHLMFEEQYKELADAIDTTAELIRGLGDKAPGTFEAYSRHASIKSGNENASADQMISELIADHDKIQKILVKALDIAQKEHDEVITGFLIERLTVHRKAAWMLKSSL